MSKSQNPTVFGNGLRDRIAAAVAVVGFSDSWATPPQPSEFDYEVADAVIRELGLKVEYGMAAQHDYSDKPEIHPVSKDDMARRTWYGGPWTYRYATEWEGISE